MRRVTHIQALTEFANALHDSIAQNRRSSEKPISALSTFVGLHAQSYQFTRLLTWLIAFYYDALSTLDDASLAERNRNTAKANLHALFEPFLPPFTTPAIGNWFSAAMSSTNQSYFDLLNDVIVLQQPIFIPDVEDLRSYETQLRDVLAELERVKLPPWIERDFTEAIQLTLLAVEKLPFVAHRLVQDAHSTILARLFSVATPEHRKFMVKVATIVNVVFAAFIMPNEASDAAEAYYGWMLESQTDVKQIAACAQPLALPAPSKKDPNKS